jgi:hypothetical protein
MHLKTFLPAALSLFHWLYVPVLVIVIEPRWTIIGVESFQFTYCPRSNLRCCHNYHFQCQQQPQPQPLYIHCCQPWFHCQRIDKSSCHRIKPSSIISTSVLLRMSIPEDNDDDETTMNKDNTSSERNQLGKETNENNDIINRFRSPQIDDPYLPLSDVVTAQVIAPGLQLFWIVLVGGPRPSWCTPYFDSGTLYGSGIGSLLAPTLIHGAALASCWLVGAIAAQAYRRDAISPTRRRTVPTINNNNNYINNDAMNKNFKNDNNNNNNHSTDDLLQNNQWDYSNVFLSIIKAGSFAIGMLIIATQFDVLIENGGRYVQLGESDETDFRLLLAVVEVTNDVVFEAITMSIWRLYLAFQTELLNQ